GVVWLCMTAGWFFFRGPGRNLFAGKTDKEKPTAAVVADASRPEDPRKSEVTPPRPVDTRPPQPKPPVSPPRQGKEPAKKPLPIPPPATATPPPQPVANNNAPTFEKHILPIFQTKCLTCHGAEKRKAGLDLRTVASMIKGSSNGTGLVPGKPDKS